MVIKSDTSNTIQYHDLDFLCHLKTGSKILILKDKKQRYTLKHEKKIIKEIHNVS